MYPTNLLLPLSQSSWTFDAPSFFIGIVAALVIVGSLYLFRRQLSDGVHTLRERLRNLRERLTASAERRYLEALRDRLVELHLGEIAAPFEEVYLPPRFNLPAPQPSLSPDRAEPRPITLHQALASTPRLAVSGAPGSGRTSLLVYLARVFAENESSGELHLEEHRLPILIHLAEIDWDAEADAEHDDPAEALVGAAILHVPRLVAANVASFLKSKIASKGLIILIDGLDEIAHSQREAAQAWMAALVKRHAAHRYVIAASAMMCDALRAAGFVCLSIAPLQPREMRAVAERWAAVAEGGAPDAAMLTESIRQPPGTTPLPLDFTLAISVWRKRGSLPLTALAAYDRWLDIVIGESGVPDALTARSILGRLAWTLLNGERLTTTVDEIIAVALETLPPAQPGKPATRGVDMATALANEAALFIPLGGGLALAHRRIAAYLAATYARDSGQALALAGHLGDPVWDDAAFFFAGLGDATPVVKAVMALPDDLFRTTLKRLGSWVSVAPADAGWRRAVMSDLVKLLMAPDTPDSLREQIVRVVASTRDKGLAYLFKQMLARPEPNFKRLGLGGFGLLRREADAPVVAALVGESDASVRVEALRALGEIGGQAAVEALAQALLDLDDDSRRVAAEALASCGKAGWDLLKEGAGLPDDQGPDVLKVRRAAAYGLARVGEGWARDVLQKLARDDKQWFVRSGATEALQLMSEDRGEGRPIDLTPLDMDNLGWLVQWSASKGQPIGLGKSAAQALQRALEDLDPTVRLAAVHTYAYLGDAEIVPTLRNRLKDDHAFVREAAYHALEEIARRKGEVVPQ